MSAPCVLVVAWLAFRGIRPRFTVGVGELLGLFMAYDVRSRMCVRNTIRIHFGPGVSLILFRNTYLFRS
jgi:hypothetical protein